MAMLRLIQNIGLLFVITTAFVTGSDIFITRVPRTTKTKTEKVNISNHILPEHYDIILIIKNGTTTYSGEINATIFIERSTHEIQMHMDSTVNIKEIRLYEQDEKYKYKKGFSSYDPESQIVSIDIGRRIPIGKYNLQISFETVIKNNTESILTKKSFSFYNNPQIKEWLIATNFYSFGARQMFPCWDEPQFIATFNLSIEHDKGYMALSHGKGKREFTKYNTCITKFVTTLRMSTHFLAFALISYPTFHYIPGTILKQDNQYLQLYTQFAQIAIGRITMHMEYEWGNLKNFPDVHHVAISDYRITEMSHWRLIFYKETDIIYDLKLHRSMRIIEIARLIARQVAYQWFAVPSSSSWPYRWLNEGLALLFGIEAIDKVFPELDFHMNLFVVQNQYESLRLNSILEKYPFKPPFNNSNNGHYNPYSKITFIMRMLQHIMTTDLFREGVKNYLKKTDSISRTLDDFLQTLQDTLDVSTLNNKVNIKYLIKCWISQTHYPEIKIIKKKDNILIEMIQESYDLNDNGYIPLTITGQSNPNFNLTSYSHIYWIKYDNYQSIYDDRNCLYYPEKGWIIVNLQQAGYYRVNYDNENWRKIISFLQNDNFQQIHVLNRAKLLDDAFYFMMHHTLDSSIFWNLTNYLYRDTDYVAWYPMFKAMENLSQKLIPFPKNIASIMIKLRVVLRMHLNIIKYEESPDDSILLKLLRQESARWACVLNDGECLRTAANYLKSHLLYKKPLLPWWKEWAYCNGLQPDIWNMIKEKKEELNVTIIEFKPECLRDSNIIIDYLISLSEEEKIQHVPRTVDFEKFLKINPNYVNNESFLLYLEHCLLIFQEIMPT
ncbi:thyrotropin-releasing hormone-degrading ectoenzyme-like [Pseudomyrmex gracilis]|uniref:thyrotropin-releasing hormone-degrading ectoenzyme-like n=1 Tax=Pseudomyrmex gracilis TaxID=219809 RepID=UPI00099508D7|nr:thyrotropin-releasing hormone-degrading ectoenzyme-like [Pseudomyrmex gracilis]